MAREWYSVKGLFRWYMNDDGASERIEERVVLFEANGFDHAIELAKAEAETYCRIDPKANFRIEAVGWWHAYWIGETPATGVEVFARGAKTGLTADAFVRRYYPKSHTVPT